MNRLLVDANLLLYATIADYPQFEIASAWLEKQLNVSQPQVGLPWATLLAYVRITTNPRIYQRPLSTEAAWTQVEEWLALPSTWILPSTGQHATILGNLLKQSQATGNLVSDAHLTTLAIEHDLILCSTDSDFLKFGQLQWLNPLA
jgi:hypothetical protein